MRKRDDEEGGGAGTSGGDRGDDGESAVVRRTKVARPGDMSFSTKIAGAVEDKSGVTFDSARLIHDGKDSKATAINETETETDRDARALREKVLSQAIDGVVPSDDGTYTGITGYKDFRSGFRNEHSVGSEKGAGAHGPLRAAQYARVSTRFDYQPDICKDYKETGFCSYGDSCKFMHDRGDYKSGWEIERDWQEEQKAAASTPYETGKASSGKSTGWLTPRKPLVLLEAKMKSFGKSGGEDDEDGEGKGGSESEDDGLPFACITCRKPWGEGQEDAKSPVVTRCRHYFCEACALKTNATKGGKCDACGKPTAGIFNVANEVVRKMKRKAAKAQAGGGM
ncbi:hypothetical protein FOA52_001004 [Chlamydomonas sp. UWO 241]|nr:hypothetical protein FOA52_001004 [Chlamydomonas sp. UWO 241]